MPQLHHSIFIHLLSPYPPLNEDVYPLAYPHGHPHGHAAASSASTTIGKERDSIPPARGRWGDDDDDNNDDGDDDET